MPLDLLTQTSQLEALAPEWRALWRTDPHATPFQSPEWLIPWWRNLGEGTLHTLVLRDHYASLQAILPAYVYTHPETRQRHLLLLGAGTSDYLDGLFAPGTTPKPFLDHLATHRDPYDQAIFHQVRASSPLLFHAPPTSPAEPTSYLDAHATLPAKIRLNSGRYLRRAQTRGTLTFAPAANPTEALHLFDILLDLQTKRWQSRAEPAVLAPEPVQRHHREAIPALLEADILRLFSLTLNGETLGILYTMLDHARQTLFFYLIAFDERFADLSPGTLLLHHARQYCQTEGITRLDYLRGGEAYKKFWGATPAPTYTFQFPGKPITEPSSSQTPIQWGHTLSIPGPDSPELPEP